MANGTLHSPENPEAANQATVEVTKVNSRPTKEDPEVCT